jgi:hypothetical protein
MSTHDREREAEAGREQQERGRQTPQEQTRGPEGVGTPQPGGPTADEPAEGHAQPGTPQSGRTP